MHIHRLDTVDAFIAFDFDDVRTSAGGTRLALDVTEAEAALLARAMTYKFAVLGDRMGGAKGAVRVDPSDGAARSDAMARYCEEIGPLVRSGRFLTGPDLGTSEADFAPLRDPGRDPSPMAGAIDGVAVEDLLTGFGVVVAAEAAMGSLHGRTVAVEGFGKVGGGVARHAARRGARVVAVSTVHGCVHAPGGLDVEELWATRREHGDRFVAHIGHTVLPVAALFDVAADVLVPGARTGVVDEARARTVAAAAVVPAANVPYTAAGLGMLQAWGVAAHADFVCNSGAVIGYRAPAGSSVEDVFAHAERRIAALVGETLEHRDGPYAGARELAERFLRDWRGADGVPPGPPLA